MLLFRIEAAKIQIYQCQVTFSAKKQHKALLATMMSGAKYHLPGVRKMIKARTCKGTGFGAKSFLLVKTNRRCSVLFQGW